MGPVPAMTQLVQHCGDKRTVLPQFARPQIVEPDAYDLSRFAVESIQTAVSARSKLPVVDVEASAYRFDIPRNPG